MPLEIDYIPDHAPRDLADAIRRAVEHPDTFAFLGEGRNGYNLTVSVSWGVPIDSLSFKVPIFEAIDEWLDGASPAEAKRAAAWFRELANMIDSGE